MDEPAVNDMTKLEKARLQVILAAKNWGRPGGFQSYHAWEEAELRLKDAVNRLNELEELAGEKD